MGDLIDRGPYILVTLYIGDQNDGYFKEESTYTWMTLRWVTISIGDLNVVGDNIRRWPSRKVIM